MTGRNFDWSKFSPSQLPGRATPWRFSCRGVEHRPRSLERDGYRRHLFRGFWLIAGIAPLPPAADAPGGRLHVCSSWIGTLSLSGIGAALGLHCLGFFYGMAWTLSEPGRGVDRSARGSVARDFNRISGERSGCAMRGSIGGRTIADAPRARVLASCGFVHPTAAVILAIAARSFSLDGTVNDAAWFSIGEKAAGMAKAIAPSRIVFTHPPFDFTQGRLVRRRSLVDLGLGSWLLSG